LTFDAASGDEGRRCPAGPTARWWASSSRRSSP